MGQIKMNEPFSDELISAYLDGELSADEQTRVEELLMDSVAHRRMFNELRTLRDSLQSLPVHRLGDDFSERVLRRAERVMLSPGDRSNNLPSGATDGDSSAATPAPPRVSKSPSNPARARPNLVRWGGAIATVVAMLVIAMVVIQSNRENRQLADNVPAFDDPAEKSPSGPSKELGKADNDLSFRATNDSLGRTEQRRMQESSSRNATQPASPDHPDQGPAQDGIAETDGGRGQAAGLAPLIAADAPGGAVPAAVGDLLKAQNDPHSGQSASGRTQAADSDATKLYVVYVDVPETEFRRRAVDVALTHNGIALRPADDFELLGQEQLSTLRQTEADHSTLKDRAPGVDADPTPPVDVLVVNATAPQMDATFADLRRRGYAMTIAAAPPADEADNDSGERKRLADTNSSLERDKANEEVHSANGQLDTQLKLGAPSPPERENRAKGEFGGAAPPTPAKSDEDTPLAAKKDNVSSNLPAATQLAKKNEEPAALGGKNADSTKAKPMEKQAPAGEAELPATPAPAGPRDVVRKSAGRDDVYFQRIPSPQGAARSLERLSASRHRRAVEDAPRGAQASPLPTAEPASDAAPGLPFESIQRFAAPQHDEQEVESRPAAGASPDASESPSIRVVFVIRAVQPTAVQSTASESAAESAAPASNQVPADDRDK